MSTKLLIVNFIVFLVNSWYLVSGTGSSFNTTEELDVINNNENMSIQSESDLVNFQVGIPLNYSYNETNNLNTDWIPSAPGCPKSYQGFPWMYYGNTPLCYLVGTQGPCRPGQLLFGNSSSNYGVCDCHCPQIVSANYTDDMFGRVVKEFPFYTFCHLQEIPEMNDLAILNENGTCMFLETQGFCSEAEWAVKDVSGQNVTCVPQCSVVTGPLSTYTFDLQKRQCTKKMTLTVQPISLSSTIGTQACEDGMVFSKTLSKCIPKSKAYLLK